MNADSPETIHRFLDEFGDATFFGRGKAMIVGHEGVSLSFSLGMLKVNEDLDELRRAVRELAEGVSGDPYLNTIQSVKKRMSTGGFYFHAKDDAPEVRERMFKWIKTVNLSLQACVARKEPARFRTKHNGDEAEFYADVLGHLIKDKLEMGKRLVLNIASRQNSTGNKNLSRALEKATGHLLRRKAQATITTKVIFNVTNPVQEPLLQVADYLCWTVQRVFERGETRHYDFLADKIVHVCDLYDPRHYEGGGNFYGRDRLLTAQNKISPPTP